MGALEAEETLRAHPIDGVVLMGGCDDQHLPVMGATSMATLSTCRSNVAGNYAGEKRGLVPMWKYWDERRAGNISKSNGKGYRVELLEAMAHV